MCWQRVGIGDGEMFSVIPSKFWKKALVFFLSGFAGRVVKLGIEVLYSVLSAEMKLVW